MSTLGCSLKDRFDQRHANEGKGDGRQFHWHTDGSHEIVLSRFGRGAGELCREFHGLTLTLAKLVVELTDTLKSNLRTSFVNSIGKSAVYHAEISPRCSQFEAFNAGVFGASPQSPCKRARLEICSC